MAGDKFNVTVNGWWKSTNTPSASPPSPITELLTALNNSIGGITSTHGGATVSELGVSKPTTIEPFSRKLKHSESN